MSDLAPRLSSHERNLIINGNFDINQRVTSATSTSPDDAKTVDRFWYHTWSSSVNITATRSTDVPTFAQSGFQSAFSLLLTSTVQAHQTVQISHTMEGYDYAQIHGKKVRFQFWVKSSAAGTYAVAFENGYGGSGSNGGAGGSPRSYVTTYSIPTANTWTPITLDVQLDSAGSWSFDRNAGLCIIWNVSTQSTAPASGSNISTLNTWQSVDGRGYTGTVDWGNSGATATFQLSQVMLIPQDFTQAGSANVVVPFSRNGKNIGDELRSCQRYLETNQEYDTPYYSSYSSGTFTKGSGTLATYYNGNSNSGMLIPVFMRVHKRVATSGGSTVRIHSTSGVIDNVRDNSAVNDKAVSYTGNGSVYNSTGFSVYVPTATTGSYIEFYWIADVDVL